MNVKAYKNYRIQLRTSDNLDKTYILSGNSNKIKHDLKELLRTLHFSNDERKDVINLFASDVQKYKIVYEDDLKFRKLKISATKNVVLMTEIEFVTDNIDIHRTNNHGEYIETKRRKQHEVINLITKERIKKSLYTITKNIEALKASNIERRILLDKLSNSEVEIINVGASCFEDAAITIDDDILIELDNFLIHGKLECIEESSYSARVALHIKYYDIQFKSNHKKFLELHELLKISRNAEDYIFDCNIEMLEKLGDELIKKLNSIECNESETNDD